jgi:hypothetical protein
LGEIYNLLLNPIRERGGILLKELSFGKIKGGYNILLFGICFEKRPKKCL